MALSDEDIREILRIVDESPLAELRIETEGFSLHVRKGAGGAPLAASPTGTARPTGTAAPAGTAARVATPPQDAPPEPQPAPPQAAPPDGAVTIDAPMLGTFYRAESPGQPPFVEVGTRIEPDSTVCIIEVMKMMNSVPAGLAGTIVEVCPQNAELVEYGQPLFRVNPAA